MKFDGRTKFGKEVKNTKQEIGLLVLPFWLFIYLPWKYIFLGIKFLVKTLIKGIKFLAKYSMVAIKRIRSKRVNND